MIKKRPDPTLTYKFLLAEDTDEEVDIVNLAEVFIMFGKSLTIKEFNQLQEPHVEWEDQIDLYPGSWVSLITRYGEEVDGKSQSVSIQSSQG